MCYAKRGFREVCDIFTAAAAVIMGFMTYMQMQQVFSTTHMVQFSASCAAAAAMLGSLMIDEKTLISPPPDQALHEV